IIHWYKQREGEAPERFLFFSGGKATMDSGFQANRYLVERVSAQKRCVLTIKDVIPDDAATYYCAYWDSHRELSDIVKALFTVTGYYNKVFGSGTELVVSEKGSSPPANSEILRKKHENQITYVCLIEKFYPEVIRVRWTHDEKEVTENVVKGGTWQSPQEEFSVASWLTVPAESQDKKYHCKYEHEKRTAVLPTQGDSVQTAAAPQEEDCGTVSNRGQLVQLSHRTAHLVYMILLLKSSVYYLTVLFLIYR
ncbi:TRGC1 protein, partial [Pomatostomus ruficeps]|nr:TRGC1 protein [Pomatostomus ruficeps]